ncbi:unnamed protein product [Cuscuta europaea]|uniref:CRAL-TRIO domain-containing protein n=1 Tax=Cuscuta europaea TaxID=41803 RepID=A0A9P0ZMQ7_CUSEU|nr:unnamed protein product [Cuscuta europaea]
MEGIIVNNNNNKVDEEAQDFSVQEKHKIELLRALLHKRADPSFQAVDDYTLRRFLGARELDVEKAAAMVIKYLKWRSAFMHISASEVPNEIAQNKMFMQGVDKQGRPIAVVFGARHIQNNNKGGLHEFKRYVAFGLDKLCARTSPGAEKFVVIGDLRDFGYANSDIKGYIAALSILQDFYPERLGKMFIVHVPYLFWTLYKVVHPFIDVNTKKKIVFVENKRLTSTLLEDIEESQLPEIYGGKQSLVPIHEA